METKVYTVTSELYAEKDYISDAKPTLNQCNVVSKFGFKFPAPIPQVDTDGDLIIERKPKDISYPHTIEIEHSANTTLELVGLQIWRGAFLLADWLMYNEKTLPRGKHILELGSGVGLTSIIAAMYSPVICTDIDKGGILDLIRSNIQRNQKYVKNGVSVMGLDFSLPFTEEFKSKLPEIDVILAADVIYDDHVTEAFVDTLLSMFENLPPRTAYIALEKRYVFTIDDLNSVAPCYEHFLTCLQKLRKLKGIKIEELSTDFPQYFEYDRVKQLILLKISSNFCNGIC